MEISPDQNNPTGSNKVSIIVFALVVLFAAGLFLVFKFKKSQKVNPLISQEKIKNTEKAETEAQDIRSIYKDNRLITGKILEINDGKLTVGLTFSDSFADSDLEARIVEVTSDTRIFQLIPKDPDQYQKELERFNDISDTPIEMPLNWDKREVSLSDLQKDQEVKITSSDDISNLKQFKAFEIDIRNEPYSLTNN